MTRGSISRLTTGAASGSAALEIIAGAARGFYLREVNVTIVAATASDYSLGRPAAKGVTPTTPVLFPQENSADPTTIVAATALAWATPPTIPATFLRRANLPAAIGSSVYWTFQQLWVPAGASIVLWNGAANSVANVDIVIDEVGMA